MHHRTDPPAGMTWRRCCEPSRPGAPPHHGQPPTHSWWAPTPPAPPVPTPRCPSHPSTHPIGVATRPRAGHQACAEKRVGGAGWRRLEDEGGREIERHGVFYSTLGVPLRSDLPRLALGWEVDRGRFKGPALPSRQAHPATRRGPPARRAPSTPPPHGGFD